MQKLSICRNYETDLQAGLGIGCLLICLIGIKENTGISETFDSGNEVYAKSLEGSLEECELTAPKDHSEEFYEKQSESIDNYNEILEAFEDSNGNTYAARSLTSQQKHRE